MVAAVEQIICEFANGSCDCADKNRRWCEPVEAAAKRIRNVIDKEIAEGVLRDLEAAAARRKAVAQ